MMLISVKWFLIEKDFPKIEKRIIEISREKQSFELKSISKKEALSFYKKEVMNIKLN